MLTVLSVIGTRPEAIKMAPVLRALNGYASQFNSIICVTGQHREMVDPVLTLFGIRPHFDLDVMEHDQTLPALTANLIARLSPIIEETAPDWILAQGDTTTVFAIALNAFYHKIKFAHVEAGLRTGNLAQPFPEEMNRRFADSIAALHFAATSQNRENLLREGISHNTIVVTGNTGADALLWAAGMPYDWSAGPLQQIPAEKPLVLVTAHRRESFGEPLREICFAIRDLASQYAECGIQFVYPVHPNPNVQRAMFEILAGISNVSLLEPLDYLSMVHLMKRCILVLTDSGGIQEESASLRVPVLVLRETTERVEGIEAGLAKLVGTTREPIVATASALIQEPRLRQQMVTSSTPYGDGKAAQRVVEALVKHSKMISDLDD